MCSVGARALLAARTVHNFSVYRLLLGACESSDIPESSRGAHRLIFVKTALLDRL